MKFSHAIILIALLTGQSASLAFASTSVNSICQFDKSTMIKEKLKKAQECINNGNYSGVKNYLNGVLKLDPNNAKAKELLAVCNNGGKPVASTRSNSSSLNSTISNRNNFSETTRAYIENAKALNYLATSIKGWNKCRLGAITENGAGVVVYGVNGYSTTGNLNSNFVAKIKELNNQKETFKSVTTTNSGYYCIVYGRNGWYGYVPERLKTILNQYNGNKEDIYCVSIAENGDFVVISDKHLDASNTTDMSNLKKASEKYGHVKYACVTNRGLIVVCEKGISYSNIPANLEVALKSISFRPDKVVFTDSGTYLISNENEAFSYNM